MPAYFDDARPPMRLREALAHLRLPPPARTRVELGVDEEGRPTLLLACDCGALSLKTLEGSLTDLPGDLCVTCEVCWASAWVAVT